MAEPPARKRPPPVETLLSYAAYGFAAHRGNFSPAGRPRTPPAREWLPEFAAMLAAPGGMARLERLTLIGMQSWGVDPSISDVLPAAFATPGLRDRLAALYPGPSPILPAALMAVAPEAPMPELVQAPTRAPVLVALTAPTAANDPPAAATSSPAAPRKYRYRQPRPG